jgi:glycosyltransferase involved in cell wall biosynthesis
MKVLHVIPSVSERSGGPGHAIISMCRSLQEQGTEVVIATTNAGIGEQITLGRAGVYRGVPTLFFPLQHGESFKYSKPLRTWLDANVKTFDVVHIHAVFNHASIAAAAACRKHDVPYVVRPLGTLDPWSMKQKPLRKFLFWQLAGKRMLRAAAAVHYTGRTEREAAENSLGLNHGRIVPLGITMNAGDTSKSRQMFFSQHPQLAGHPYVLSLSRVLPTKGLSVLVNAFLSIREQPKFQNWRLVLAGDGPSDYAAELKQRVSAHHAEDVVLFPGWLEGDEKAAFLQGAALLALPSYHENFGLCVMEALAVGVPVLVSPYVSLADEIETAGAGWIAAVDKEAIETALAEALGSEDERGRRGAAGKTLSLEFSCERVAARLNEMYAAVSAIRN